MNSVGGLAASRLLSLCFMLAATALLYSTARQFFGTAVSIIRRLFSPPRLPRSTWVC